MRLNETVDHSSTSLLAWYARARCAAKAVGDDIRWAEAAGAPSSVIRMLQKTAVGAGSTVDGDWGSADYYNAQNAFIAAAQTASVFYRLFADNAFLKMPLRTRVGVTSANATGFIMGQGKPRPLSRLRLANHFLEPVTAAALIVASDELIKNITPAGQTLFNNLMRQAVAAVVDQKFFDLIIDGDTPIIQSLGPDDAAVMSDMRSLLSGVAIGEGANLYFIVAEDVAKAASTMPLLFPAMSATGGELLNLPAIVSNVVDTGTITLVNAAAIAANSDTIELRTSRQTNIEMSDTPSSDGSTGTGSTSVSMFQTDSAALMAVASFAAERLRNDAVAQLRNIAWGGEVTV